MTPNEQMLTAILDCARIDLYTRQIIFQPDEQKLYEEMQARYAHGEPLQYIIGFTEFYGCRIFVGPQVLIPRPETEIMVDKAAHILKAKAGAGRLRVLDLGTGSGNIAVALAKCVGNIRVTAVDVSPLALTMAKQNAHFNGVEDKITFVCEDMQAFLQRPAAQPYDMVISNPPYIRTADLAQLPKDVKHEPRLALDGGEDGLQFYRNILACAGGCLREGGELLLEIGDGQFPMVKALMPAELWSKIEAFEDYVRTQRIVYAVKNMSPVAHAYV